MNFKNLISLLVFIVGFSLFGMELDKPVAHVITYKNGQEEAPIAIDKETLNILKDQCQTINHLTSFEKKSKNDTNRSEIPLPNISTTDYYFALPYIHSMFTASPSLKNPIPVKQPPKNLSDLNKLFSIADYLGAQTLFRYTVNAYKNFRIKNLISNLDSNYHSLHIPDDVLNELSQYIETEFAKLTNEHLLPTIVKKCSKNLSHACAEYIEPINLFSKLYTLMRGSKNSEVLRNDYYPLIVFNADNSLMASVECNHIDIWNMKTHQLLHSLAYNSNHFQDLGFLGNLLVAINDQITIWHAPSGKHIKAIKNLEYKIALSSDTKLLAVTNELNNVTDIYCAQTGKIIKQVKNGKKYCPFPPSVSFSSDNKILAVGSMNGINLWNTQTWNCLKTLSFNAEQLKFTPSNNMLITLFAGETELIDVEIDKSLDILHDAQAYQNVQYKKDGTLLISSNGIIKLWDVKNRNCIKVIKTKDSYHTKIKLSPDGAYLLSQGEDNTKIWHVNDGKCLQSFPERFSSIKFNPESTMLALASQNTEDVKLFDIEKGKFRNTLSNQCKDTKISSIKFFNNALLATSSHNNDIELWDITTSKCIGIGHNNIIHDNQIFSKQSNKTHVINLSKYKKSIDALFSLSAEQKLLILWSQKELDEKSIEKILNNYLSLNSKAIRSLLDQTFNIKLKPYQPLTDLADTAKKAYLLNALPHLQFHRQVAYAFSKLKNESKKNYFVLLMPNQRSKIIAAAERTDK